MAEKAGAFEDFGVAGGSGASLLVPCGPAEWCRHSRAAPEQWETASACPVGSRVDGADTGGETAAWLSPGPERKRRSSPTPSTASAPTPIRTLRVVWLGDSGRTAGRGSPICAAGTDCGAGLGPAAEVRGRELSRFAARRGWRLRRDGLNDRLGSGCATTYSRSNRRTS